MVRLKGSGTAGGVAFRTSEYDKAGRKHAVTATFRNFNSFAEAADDYGRLVTTDRRYAKALPYRDDPYQFAEVTGRVYATNPAHARLLVATIRSHRLTEYDY